MSLVTENKIFYRICRAFDGEETTLQPFHHHTPRDTVKGCYPYISSLIRMEPYIREAKLAFKKLHGRPAKTFLDLGSGKGGVLFVASLMKLQAEGVEHSKELIDICKDIIGLNKFKGWDNIQVHEGNIQTWIPTKDYDIVYYYRPIADQKEWRKFENHFLKTFPIGQVVVSMGHEQTDKFKHITQQPYMPIYQKVS